MESHIICSSASESEADGLKITPGDAIGGDREPQPRPHRGTTDLVYTSKAELGLHAGGGPGGAGVAVGRPVQKLRHEGLTSDRTQCLTGCWT